MFPEPKTKSRALRPAFFLQVYGLYEFYYIDDRIH